MHFSPEAMALIWVWHMHMMVDYFSLLKAFSNKYIQQYINSGVETPYKEL